MKLISSIFNFDKQTLRNLAVFARKVLTIAVIVGVLDYTAGILLKMPAHPLQIASEQKVQIYQAMLRDSESYQAVAVGSSLTQSGFNPEVFDRYWHGHSFNAGIAGESNVSAILATIKEVVEAKHPRLILYGIDSWSLNVDPVMSEAQKPRPQMLQFLQLFQRREEAKDWILGLRKGYSALPPAFRKPEDTEVGRRFASFTSATAFPDGFVDFRAVAKTDFSNGMADEFSPRPQQIAALQKIIGYLAAHKVRLILIQFPELQLEVDRNAERHLGFENFIRPFAAVRGISFLDFDSDIPFPRGNITNFYDPNHLNAHGAFLFTSRLAELVTVGCDDPTSWCFANRD